MMNFTIEYQIVVDTKTGMCESIDSFKSLLNVNSKVKVSELEINFENSIYEYALELAKYPERQQNIFTLLVRTKANHNEEKFQQLLKIIRELLHKTSLSINILWDDLSGFYSEKAYPYINNIENLLRKLITKFMVNTVGVNWTEESLPKDLKREIDKGAKTSYSNVLHSTDFIHLADFLFKPYANEPIELLFKEARKNKDFSLDSALFGPYLPKSNWERYFSTIVNCEDNYFKKRWERLYELRCLVAHNSFFTKNELIEVKEITKDIKTILEKAISELNQIDIPENEKEDLLENAVKNNNEINANFLNKWKELEQAIIAHANNNKNYKTAEKSKIIHKIKKPQAIFDSDGGIKFRKNINALINVRRHVIHQINPIISEKRLLKHIKDMDRIINGLK